MTNRNKEISLQQLIAHLLMLDFVESPSPFWAFSAYCGSHSIRLSSQGGWFFNYNGKPKGELSNSGCHNYQDCLKTIKEAI